jgi:hypothetical protein
MHEYVIRAGKGNTGGGANSGWLGDRCSSHALDRLVAGRKVIGKGPVLAVEFQH